ncbi:tRNA wybutosine-synthesizing protein 3 homolog isoform X4 [Nematostella vectensis]|uniref:tRNA wybutosine-synthesizing protein 3 homolog isoform X4 n=1 Tax=Nematostella vectensis TaxID=45351 RepID=UPI00138FB389|nr:tRNA wybutosine-synthesizing protein 3 homolog isoform X4 [Nematostella vectensis]
MAAFMAQKQQTLSQADLSKKGSIDEPIVNLVDYINGLDAFFTTSSCSGRISVFTEGHGQRKKCSEWRYITHGQADLESVLESLEDCKRDAVLKFEPFVLHVQCKSLEHAQLMLKASLESGYKNSGIVIGRKSRYMMAVRSTHSLEVPLICNGNLLVSKEYIQYVVDMANKKMEDNKDRIQRFYTKLKEAIQAEKKKREPNADKRRGSRRTPHLESEKTSSVQDVLSNDDSEDIEDCLAGFYGDLDDK